MATTLQATMFIWLAKSIAGEMSDQKDAAIMTPPAKPSIKFNIRLLIVLKKKTSPAPKAVMNHVKIVAINACVGAPNPINQFILSPLIFCNHPYLMKGSSSCQGKTPCKRYQNEKRL